MLLFYKISPTEKVLKGVHLEACVLYFVKTTIVNFGESGLTLQTAVLHNGSFETTNFEESLFWILPGKLLFQWNRESLHEKGHYYRAIQLRCSGRKVSSS